MKKLREILRLKFTANLTHRQIAAATNTSASSVSYYTRAAVQAGISWPIDPELDDLKLLAILTPYCKQFSQQSCLRVKPNLLALFKEMQRKHVTLQLLWEEYKALNPENSYSYSNFCLRYRKWCKHNKISMRQIYKPGDKCFIDYAGTPIPIYAADSELIIMQAQLFIAVLGASDFTYVEATATQTLPDWLASHVRAFEYFGGVPAILIPDNLLAGIKDSCKYDPIANPSYLDLAIHYDTTILPARPYTPKDKAKAELGVQIAQRWIVAKLRDTKFYSLNNLNTAIQSLLIQLNNKPFKKKVGNRSSQFIELEQANLRRLPVKRYEQAYFKQLKVHLDYHIELDGHYYSVPYHLAGEIVECRYTQATVEILHNNQRVASHARNYVKSKATTSAEHMPAAHKAHAEWTPQTFLAWAKKLGRGVENIVQNILNTKKHPDQIYRLYLGFRQLTKRYGDLRLNTACLRATAINAMSYQSINSILRAGLDQQEFLKKVSSKEISKHKNVRGSSYYQDH